ARSGLAVANGQILQLALAALVTDRAVQRVIDQQKVHHRVLRGNRLFRARVNDHAVGNARDTGGQCLGRLLDVDQAHTAVGRDGKLLVIGKVRNVDTKLARGLDDHAAFGNVRLDAVDGDFNH